MDLQTVTFVCLWLYAVGGGDKNKDNGILFVMQDVIKFLIEVVEVAKTDNEHLNHIYREISEAMGIDTAMEMYRLFRGQQITFPVRFFNPQCIKRKIAEEYDGKNIGFLAQKYDYSEKTIRRIIKDSVKHST